VINRPNATILACSARRGAGDRQERKIRAAHIIASPVLDHRRWTARIGAELIGAFKPDRKSHDDGDLTAARRAASSVRWQRASLHGEL